MSKKKLDLWYPWYVGKWRRKTNGLTCEQKGIYRELLDEYYIRAAEGRKLDADLGFLYRIVGAHTPSEKVAVELICGAFFQRHGDFLSHLSADDQLAYQASQAESGSKGGKAKAASERVSEGGSEIGSGRPSEQCGEKLASKVKDKNTTQSQSHKIQHPSARTARGEGTAAWEGYRTAYLQRYGTEPVRNAKVNSTLGQLVQRLGIDEAPQVAAFYVGHNRSIYVANKHSTGLLLRDAEGLRTEWATSRPVSDTEARQADRSMATAGAFADLIAEAEAQEAGKVH